MFRAQQLSQKHHMFYKSRVKPLFTQRLKKINQENVEMPASFYCAISLEFSNNPVMFNAVAQQMVDKAIAEEWRGKSSKCPFTNEEITGIFPHYEKISQIDKFINNLEKIHRLEIILSEARNEVLKNLEDLKDSFSDEEFITLKHGQLLSVSKPHVEQIIDELTYHLIFIESIFDTELLDGATRKNESERVSTPYLKKLEHYKTKLNHEIEMDSPFAPLIEDVANLDLQIKF